MTVTYLCTDGYPCFCVGSLLEGFEENFIGSAPGSRSECVWLVPGTWEHLLDEVE